MATNQATKFHRLRKSKDHKKTRVILKFDVYAPKRWNDDQVKCFAIAFWGGLKEEDIQKLFGSKDDQEATMVMV